MGSLIIDTNEWRYLKRLVGANTPVEEGLLQGNKLLLQANEYVHIPFKFQSFKCGQIQAATQLVIGQQQQQHPLGEVLPDEPIRARTIHVVVANEHSRPVNVVEVQVFPQSFVID